MSRLFIALKLPAEVVDEIISIYGSIYIDNIKRKWESREKLHLTLKFLGEVEDSKAKQICDRIEAVIKGRHKILCSFDRFGFFLPRILWLSLKTDEQLNDIVFGIENEMEVLGFEKEKRKFKPHITLLRIKENLKEDFIAAYRNYELPKKQFYCNEIALVNSKLLPGGSVYSDIKKFQLI